MTDTADQRPLRAVPPNPSAAPPSGPYLCGSRERIPVGWLRTGAPPDTSTCMAYDPARHTVVASLNVRFDRKLVEAVTLAGFERYQVPGSDTGFFARDRTDAPVRPRPTPSLERSR